MSSQGSSEWKNVKLGAGCKVFRVHNFTYMHKGTNFHLEVDEFTDGTFTGHGEQSTDKSSVIESVSGKSLEETLQALISGAAGRKA